jgi:Flp pilus assembly pilin Flp
MRQLLSRFRRAESGQAMVEFALILPVILLLLVGMLEFARAWNLHQVMTDAAREGARRAVLANATMDADSVKAAMWRHLAQFGYDPAEAEMNIIGNFKVAGDPITVELKCPYAFWVLPWISPGNFVMRTSFTMRNE